MVSAYMDIKLDMVQPWLIKFLEYANKKKYPIFIGADSNAHSTLYGNTTNTRGEALEELFIKYGLNIENIGLTPTFSANREDGVISSIIDITISRGLRGRIRNWRVDTEYNGSDHNTIRFELHGLDNTKVTARKWNSADWDAFTECLDKYRLYHPERINEKKLDKMVNCLYKVINSCLLYTSPSPRD